MIDLKCPHLEVLFKIVTFTKRFYRSITLHDVFQQSHQFLFFYLVTFVLNVEKPKSYPEFFVGQAEAVVHFE